jgi:hypothetical protein
MYIETIAPPTEWMARSSVTLRHFMEEECTFQWGLPNSQGWVTLNDLTTPPTTALQTHLDTIGKVNATNSAKVRVMYAFGGLNWVPVLVALCTYLQLRRVPDLATATIAFRFNDKQEPQAVRFFAPRFACLPNDPLAQESYALPCSGQDALRDYLRNQLEGFTERLITALRPYSSTNPKTLWWAMADRITGNLAWLTGNLGCSDTLLDEWSALVQQEGSPFQGPTGFFTTEWQGNVDYHLDRAVCCLWYKTGAAVKCTSCCLRPLEERKAKMLAYRQAEEALV